MNVDPMGATEDMEDQEKKPCCGGVFACCGGVKKITKLALFPMIALVIFSLIVDETYPFSDFPMYSKLPDHTVYYYLADGKGDPLPVKDCFGVSASAMKKMYIKRLTQVVKEQSKEMGKRIRGKDLSTEQKEMVGDDLLDYLLPRGEKKAWWLENQPEVIRLVQVDIQRTDAEGLVETPILIVERKLKRDES